MSFENSTEGALRHFIEFQELQPFHCSKDALTDFFGWLLQGLLAAIAFSCLIGESKEQKVNFLNRIMLLPCTLSYREHLRHPIFKNSSSLFQLKDFASLVIDVDPGTFGGMTRLSKGLARWSST